MTIFLSLMLWRRLALSGRVGVGCWEWKVLEAPNMRLKNSWYRESGLWLLRALFKSGFRVVSAWCGCMHFQWSGLA